MLPPGATSIWLRAPTSVVPSSVDDARRMNEDGLSRLTACCVGIACALNASALVTAPVPALNASDGGTNRMLVPSATRALERPVRSTEDQPSEAKRPADSHKPPNASGRASDTRRSMAEALRLAPVPNPTARTGAAKSAMRGNPMLAGSREVRPICSEPARPVVRTLLGPSRAPAETSTLLVASTVNWL